MLKRILCTRATVRLLRSGNVLETPSNKSVLGKLRKKTGFPIGNCKKALEQCDYNLQQAEALLKQEAKKAGWDKASQLQGRETGHGLIGIATDKTVGAMVEVNCETDFVGKNQNFQTLVSRIAGACLHFGRQQRETKLLMDQLTINDLLHDGVMIKDLVAMEIGILGENISVRRGVIMQAASPLYLSHYVHSSGKALRIGGCSLGKYGAFIVFKQSVVPPPQTITSEKEMPLEEPKEILKPHEAGRQLCQHIVGMSPSQIGDSEDEPSDNTDEETTMINQEFLLDADITVNEFLKENYIEVKDFIRYECSEEIPTSEVDIEKEAISNV